MYHWLCAGTGTGESVGESAGVGGLCDSSGDTSDSSSGNSCGSGGSKYHGRIEFQGPDCFVIVHGGGNVQQSSSTTVLRCTCDQRVKPSPTTWGPRRIRATGPADSDISIGGACCCSTTLTLHEFLRNIAISMQIGPICEPTGPDAVDIRIGGACCCSTTVTLHESLRNTAISMQIGPICEPTGPDDVDISIGGACCCSTTVTLHESLRNTAISMQIGPIGEPTGLHNVDISLGLPESYCRCTFGWCWWTCLLCVHGSIAAELEFPLYACKTCDAGAAGRLRRDGPCQGTKSIAMFASEIQQTRS